MTFGERLRKVRKVLDLTQQEFADKIGSKRNTVATYEMGRTDPSAAVISLICREFSVSETWLRTGDGEMFLPLSPDDELSHVFSAIAASDDELIKRIIRAYWKLDDREKAAVKKLIDGFSPGGSGTLPIDTGQQAEPKLPSIRPMIQAAARSGGVTEIEEISPNEVSGGDAVP